MAPSDGPLDGIGELLDHESRRLVGADADGWFLVDYVPTGRLRQHAYRIGNATYSADVPEVAPRILARADSLQALAADHGEPEDDPEGAARWAAYYAEQAALRAGWDERDRALADAVRTAILARITEAASNAAPLTPQDRRPCRNCDGLGGKERHDCSCKALTGHRHLGLIAHADDIVLDDPAPPSQPPGEPDYDPACPDCHGTGTYLWMCPVCTGSGVNAACYALDITGPAGHTTVLLDIAALLRSGDATLRVDLAPINRATHVRVSAELTPLIERINAEVADGQGTWTVFRGHHRDWARRATATLTVALKALGDPGGPTGAPYRADDGPFSYRLVDPYRRAADDADGHPEPWVALDGIEAILPDGARLLGLLQETATPQPWADLGEADGITRGADGSMEAKRVVAVLKPTVQEAFRDLLEQAGSRGYALGFDYSFIATGESGPAVYLLSPDGQAHAQLGLDHQWRTALADAAVALPEAVRRLRERDA